MTMSASVSLIVEAFALESDRMVFLGRPFSHAARACSGALAGVIFVTLCQLYLQDQGEGLSIRGVKGLEPGPAPAPLTHVTPGFLLCCALVSFSIRVPHVATVLL